MHFSQNNYVEYSPETRETNVRMHRLLKNIGCYGKGYITIIFHNKKPIPDHYEILGKLFTKASKLHLTKSVGRTFSGVYEVINSQ